MGKLGTDVDFRCYHVDEDIIGKNKSNGII